MMIQATETDRNLDSILYSMIGNMTVPVSGEKLAQDLGISHSRVARLVDRLRGEGVEILGAPFSGFRLTRLPDVLIPELVIERLHTKTMGRNLVHLWEVDSTNAFAGELVSSNRSVPHGTTVVAERQTSGRGRRGRHWVSDSGDGLYVSIVLKPDVSANLAPLLTLGAALAAHDSIERTTELQVDIKWPNDLLIGRKKVCGILSEMHAELDQVRSMVVGVGINVNHSEMPEAIREIGTSLRMESGRSHSRIEVLVDFLTAFEKIYDRFVAKGPVSITQPWTELSSFAHGRMVAVHDGVRQIEGTTEGLSALGALRIRQDDGRVEEVYSGDVVHWE
jgi:BirA family biotin operon repressor/biotin-[acetyl-CoA-carboxylase] ligase